MHFPHLCGLLSLLGSTLVVVATPIAGILPNQTTPAEARFIVKRSFLNTCLYCSLSNPAILSCWCTTVNDQFVSSSLDLNNCIANDNGKLRWAVNGGFVATCNSANYEWRGLHILSANCRTIASSFVRTSTHIRDNIHNDNGKLRCTA